MYNYDKNYIAQRASNFGFIRDTLEKVYRLADILEHINSDPTLKGKLALKGGTAINLTVFNLPRLSVDIDFDYLSNDSKEEMLQNRMIINTALAKFMEFSGYKLSPKTKTPHSLDSWIYEYVNCGGNKDNIKIEINYSLRSHVFPAQEMRIVTEHFESEYNLNCLNALEIFGSKINALISRAAARDLYDVYNMIKFRLFDESEEQLLRKCVVFYAAISAREINKSFDTEAIDRITKYKIRTDLVPVLTKQDPFDLDSAKKAAKEYISEIMAVTPQEQEFLERFEVKEYKPELLFDDADIIDRIKSHPMALWKIR
ncbi:nucleotidyl transferase AbiEii/AbiGii toxin family protein [Dehalobacter sp. TeCB1]|uniref:nucleotidyl transferase AbiEii/AbiGii toxin family protein n=1 Tax=Dehalobacter sp. TeCB1 TaxID=1843715 RepID=UPI00083B7277|nr:nucleotidyl transferase AbiEii/AbiGii toxin family protein [Dehalobacter sp. TeCB1]OCZ49928.1 nucleotidyltransferase [Dehalobacter sp. TeCB1]